MSEESSKQLKKRGQPNHFPTGNQKTNKRITDQKARLENRKQPQLLSSSWKPLAASMKATCCRQLHIYGYVFDGQPLDLKKQELAKRYSKRADATEDLQEAMVVFFFGQTWSDK
ncbi:hypothetical protein GOBAR_AA12410 [Gossypium barbadense]|uniref:Uncharacterized protein n=1 Tax=Gossypium barbadense TaxID=3634 RepID=A0A2P5XY67_GOSBA|nr:hypothetical protein GOBAR_AA12410 [Gossypium barbadense]